MLFNVPESAMGLWKNLGFWGVEMPWFEAKKAKDVRQLSDLGLVKFVRSTKPEPAVCLVLTAKGWFWKFAHFLFT